MVGLGAEFAVEATAGLVGVFAGVLLALWADRSRRRREEGAGRLREEAGHKETRRTILASVVRNASEAKHLIRALSASDDPYLFHVAFEASVWTATQTAFVRFATLEERVVFTRFFDRVQRLTTLMDFYRHLRSQIEIRGGSPDAGDQELVSRCAALLGEVAEDARLDGVLLVTDYGEEAQKRLVGVRPEAPPSAP